MTSLEELQQILDADPLRALGTAARWPTLGVYKEDVTRGWAANRNPAFYADMGQDPAALVAKGVAAVRAMVAGGKAPVVDCGRPHPAKGCNCTACRKATPRRKAVSPLTKKGF